MKIDIRFELDRSRKELARRNHYATAACFAACIDSFVYCRAVIESTSRLCTEFRDKEISFRKFRCTDASEDLGIFSFPRIALCESKVREKCDCRRSDGEVF